MSDDEHTYISEDGSASDEDESMDPQDGGGGPRVTAAGAPYQVMVDHGRHVEDEANQPSLEVHTSRRMTKYEYARVKGVRMEQLQRGSIPFVPYQPTDTAATLFRREFVQGLLPLKVERKLPDGRSVYLRIRDFAHRDAAEYD